MNKDLPAIDFEMIISDDVSVTGNTELAQTCPRPRGISDLEVDQESETYQKESAGSARVQRGVEKHHMNVIETGISETKMIEGPMYAG